MIYNVLDIFIKLLLSSKFSVENKTKRKYFSINVNNDPLVALVKSLESKQTKRVPAEMQERTLYPIKDDED